MSVLLKAEATNKYMLKIIDHTHAFELLKNWKPVILFILNMD